MRRRFLLASLTLLVGACDDNVKPSTPCDAYAACCASLNVSLQTSCDAQLQQFKNYTDQALAAQYCQNALTQLRAQGACAAGAAPATTPPPDAGAPDAPSGYASSCMLRSIAAPTARCLPATVACIANGQTKAAQDACFNSDADCTTCFDTQYDHCVVGDPSSPGRCAALFACAADCIDAHCLGNDQACIDQAKSGPCAAQWQPYDNCWNPNAPENQACAKGVYDVCSTSAPGLCGNGVVDPGETCDGNCPTCPPAQTMPCVTYEQIGSAATCNLQCLQTPVPNCMTGPACPISSSSAIGPSVWSGSFLDLSDGAFGGATRCSQGRQAVYAWSAPSAGNYTFNVTLSATDASGYQVDINGMGEIEIMSGATCGAGTSLGCGTVPGANYHTLALTMTAGESVLVIASLPVTSLGYRAATYALSITTCTPSCSGKACGDDGCGGSCGTCPGTQSCVSGQCQCVPTCGARSCGSNGCGGSCGTCASTETCSSAGYCVCTPNCSGKSCGADGCGGSCGSCGIGTTCSGSSCVANECDPIANTGCASPNECLMLSSGTPTCAVLGTGTQGSSCSSTVLCAGGYACFANTCRKICDATSGTGCAQFGLSCSAVLGWTNYGTCG
jgi:hypothetical protein